MVLEWLLNRGHSQVDVARMLAVSQGFISLVKSRERSFTLDHLQAIADALGVPLGAMMLQATKPVRPDPRTAELFEATERLIRKADQASELIRQNIRAKSKSA
jgi:transcriptional regulator with XRE-family HTH domain